MMCLYSRMSVEAVNACARCTRTFPHAARMSRSGVMALVHWQRLSPGLHGFHLECQGFIRISSSGTHTNARLFSSYKSVNVFSFQPFRFCLRARVLCRGDGDSAESHLASMMLELGLLVPGPVGLHLIVYISLLWARRSWTHISCFILQIWEKKEPEAAF